ncbi:Uncharacterised protein [Salmonella enterica subsp. diarizonae]|uniref:Uncharacterized protein n=1 Tax=Salmonella diarizonae TaxID=59204 RepID=A0A379TYE8_SALDZ|nr:Uncharacterised protein [Salmonella enterica subsp. diarizonae]
MDALELLINRRSASSSRRTGACRRAIYRTFCGQECEFPIISLYSRGVFL